MPTAPNGGLYPMVQCGGRYSHSFQSEETLADAMEETLLRDSRVLSGEKYEVVAGYEAAADANGCLTGGD